jgi:hypothetical protein
MSSGDSHKASVHMQMAVAEEFGLDSHPAPRMSPAAYHEMTLDYPARAAFYRRMVRVQYEYTQEQFSIAGITYVSLYRGMNFTSASRPPWAMHGKHVPRLQPANSWSSSPGVAKRFGRTTLTATIPVSHIIGSARTGFGCYNEYEFVVLGTGTGEVEVEVK